MYPKFLRLILPIVSVVLGFSVSGIVHAAQHWQMTVGEVRVIQAEDVARVAVGDGHVVNALTTEEKEVIVFAKNDGHTSIQIWLENGDRLAYQVEVSASKTRRERYELQSLLRKLPGVEVREVGENLIVQGDHLSDRVRHQLRSLSERYGQMLDLTDNQGWDQMVLLDVQVVEVPRNALRQLGLRWGDQLEGGVNAGLAWEQAGKGLLGRPGETVVPTELLHGGMQGYFGINALLSARVQALTEIGAATVLAQPQLLARSGSTAEFLAGGELPYTNTDRNGNSTTQFKPYGVALKITPSVQTGGAVRSFIDVEVSSIDNSVAVENGPPLKTRRTTTEFNVQSGQTLVLSGFISREQSRNYAQVPGLGSMPVLGSLFRSERFQRNETELAVFVTPHVVDASRPELQERVHRAQAIVATQFPEANGLNAPLGSLGERPSWALPVLPLSVWLALPVSTDESEFLKEAEHG